MLMKVDQAVHAFELRVGRGELTAFGEIAIATVRVIRDSMTGLTADRCVEAVIFDVTQEMKIRLKHNPIIMNVCNYVIARLVDEIQSTAEPAPVLSPVSVAVTRSTSRGVLDMLIRAEEQEKYSTAALKLRMCEVLSMLEESISSASDHIAVHGVTMLKPNDVVLMVGWSGSSMEFLKRGAQTGMTVMVPERAPVYDGAQAVQELRNAGIKTFVVQDAAVFALLPKVTKVIITVRSVFANGGVMSHCLSRSVALAARHYSKPVIALYSQMKLTNTTPAPHKTLTKLLRPVVLECGAPPRDVVTLNPDGDYVSPELITVLVNEDGPNGPAEIYPLAQEILRYQD